MAKRIITTDVLEEDVKNDANLRPQTLDEYIGQEKAKSNLKFISRQPGREGIPWTTCCFMALQALEKPPLPESLPTKCT